MVPMTASDLERLCDFFLVGVAWCVISWGLCEIKEKDINLQLRLLVLQKQHYVSIHSSLFYIRSVRNSLMRTRGVVKSFISVSTMC